MPLDFISSCVTSHGRLARGSWIFRLAALAVSCTALGLLAQALAGDTAAALFAALFLWCAGALSIQRLHDIGRTGLSLSMLLVPVLGPLWLAFQLAQRGVEGSNRHGPDPVARMDYLKVNISK